MANDNVVTMSLASYNQIKAENTKFQMFMQRLFEDAELRADYSGIEFDTKKLEDLVHLVYPDAYKKKLSTLRTLQTKLSLKELRLKGELDTQEAVEEE